MKKYSAIEFVVQRGRVLALLVGALAVLIGVALAFSQQAWSPAIVGVALGVAIWGALRLLSEIVDVISETLLPR